MKVLCLKYHVKGAAIIDKKSREQVTEMKELSELIKVGRFTYRTQGSVDGNKSEQFVRWVVAG